MKITTTIKCFDECCGGCLIGETDEEDVIVFKCNECNEENGRGVIKWNQVNLKTQT